MGRPKKTINELIRGKIALTPDTALQLEKVLDLPARFWNNLEMQYREALARQQEAERLMQQNEWLNEVPWLEMDRRAWLPSFRDTKELTAGLLSYFKVASSDAYYAVWAQPQATYRKSPKFESNPHALAAWLRQGQIVAEKVDCGPFDTAGFRSALDQVRRLTTEEPEVFQHAVRDLCRPHGVAVVFIQELLGTRASGATHWLTKEKAIIQLSLRFRTNDHLWFSLFHEAAHVLLHGKRHDTFVDDEQYGDSQEEREANDFAGDFLIPPDAYARFRLSGTFSNASVVEFAREIDVAPGIVVGRLQHDGYVPFSHLNGLKVGLIWGYEKTAK